MNTNDIKTEIEESSKYFFRHSYSSLGLYGKEQEAMYGKKENLMSRLENHYGITLGKQVRVLRGDTILFFPTKTGLSGKLAFCDWDVYDVDFCFGLGLTSIKPCTSDPERDSAKLLQTIAFRNSDYTRGTPLFAYQYRDFYIAPSESFGKINFARITDPTNPYCIDKPEPGDLPL